MKILKFRALLQDSGWLCPAYVGVDPNGKIQYVSEDAPIDPSSIEAVDGFAIPGFQNAHSHAFQFAMAGMAERHPSGSMDDFWSWREAMYKCALAMSPDSLQAVAAMLYSEMLKKGYTHVAEFHYLHHDQNGKHFSNLAEMGERLLAAAQEAGIKITLIPIFYQKGNFGKDPQPRQCRFISDTVEDYFQLLDDSAHAVTRYPDARLGFGVHSLRAVDHEDIKTTFMQGPPTLPFHLHAAEQLKEVEECIGFLNKRPVEWLLQNLPLNERFHLVHCTHMNDAEVKGLASSRAHAVLCPGTEGNLGDGIFNLTEYSKHGGNWSIGTDSHISLNPFEDLRWLDYAQRFTTHKRNTFDDGARVLYNKMLYSGRMAMGNAGINTFFEVGRPLDAIVIKGDSPLFERGTEHLLPSMIYTADSASLLGTLVNAKWVVKNQVHFGVKRIRSRFKEAIRTLSY